MTSLRSIGLLLGVLAVVGCGDDDVAPSGTDSGIRVDSGTSAGDGGGGGGMDAGGGGLDAATASDSGGAAIDASAPRDAGQPSDGGVDDFCVGAATECAWGEIDHEILVPTDCICLFGCPSIPQSRTTVDRRMAQYTALCTPGVDGMGDPCPVDDCVTPPALVCIANHCVPRPDAGG